MQSLPLSVHAETSTSPPATQTRQRPQACRSLAQEWPQLLHHVSNLNSNLPVLFQYRHSAPSPPALQTEASISSTRSMRVSLGQRKGPQTDASMSSTLNTCEPSVRSVVIARSHLSHVQLLYSSPCHPCFFHWSREAMRLAGLVWKALEAEVLRRHPAPSASLTRPRRRSSNISPESVHARY